VYRHLCTATYRSVTTSLCHSPHDPSAHYIASSTSHHLSGFDFFLLKKILFTITAHFAAGGAMLWLGLFPTDFNKLQTY
jgi:hypothetical protein